MYARCIHLYARCIHAIHVREVHTCTRGAYIYTRGVYMPYMYARCIHIHEVHTCIRKVYTCTRGAYMYTRWIHVHEVHTCTRGAYMYTRGVYIPMRVGIQGDARRSARGRRTTRAGAGGEDTGFRSMLYYNVLSMTRYHILLALHHIVSQGGYRIEEFDIKLYTIIFNDTLYCIAGRIPNSGAPSCWVLSYIITYHYILYIILYYILYHTVSQGGS
jgi:hypothetical protein